MRRSWIWSGITMMIVLSLLPGAHAKKELVDKIVAVVDDEAIFKSKVDQMVSQYMLQQGGGDVSEVQRSIIEKRVLEDLVGNTLIVVQARRLGVDVSFSEVEENVEKAIEQNRKMIGGDEAFNMQLMREGLTMDELKKLYREQIKNRMLVERVLAREINRDQAQISETDLRSYYEEKKDGLPKRPGVVHLSTIFIKFKSSSRASVATKQKLEDILNQIKAGAAFTEMAKIHSEDPSAERGGDLGFLNLDDISDPAFVAAAKKLSPGEISPPVLTGFGYHLIQNVEENAVRNEVHLRHILIVAKPGDEDIAEIFKEAKDIRTQIESGVPFDTLAVRHSDDEATASKGGDLGWLKVADLPEFFREVLGDLKIGEVSQVLRESTGFRIVKLFGREEEREYQFEEVRDDLRNLVEQERLNTMYDDYIKSLRDKYYVDIRN
jgi:peptidyl-prolyl cis-trans isomerase SurA